ncbi:MAG TPA: right-handed parallel beta-helix repeat-containing protein [Phycisphaerae bacterium]|nr:right-handed parallel beta-helix repeat-containing protein [Phycisphaerae bacterium]
MSRTSGYQFVNQLRKFLLVSVALAAWVTPHFALAADCNDNGVDDATDISGGASLDCGDNGIPDECEPEGVCISACDLVVLDEDFEAYTVGSDPVDWFDTQAGSASNEDDGLYSIAGVGGSQAFHTDSSGTNIHSHYVGPDAATLSNMTYTGRMRISDDDGGIGVTFLSQFSDQPGSTYEYLRLRRANFAPEARTFQLAPPNFDYLFGEADSGVDPVVDTWYRFRIDVDTTGAQMRIQAKVWEEGQPEPADYQIDAVDPSGQHPTSGTVGIWSMGAGEKYWDDLHAVSRNALVACDDLDACTIGDVCMGGVCQGVPINCSQFDVACLAGVCNPATGMCESPAVEPDCNTNGKPDACEYSVPVSHSKLLAPDGAAGDQFGTSVDLEDSTAVVGANFGRIGGVSDSGAVYVFEEVNGEWQYSAKLSIGDPATDDRFGYSVSISGSNIVVGSSRDDDDGVESGAAYVFASSGGGWQQVAKLTANDAAPGDLFGTSVALEGDTVLVGAHADDDNGSRSGSVYVFRKFGAVWQQIAKLNASDPLADALFGRDVALSGDTAVVGAYGAAKGGVSDCGAAYVFREINGVWQEIAKLTADDAGTGDWFGLDVDIDGDTIVVGSFQDDDGAVNSGAVYVFSEFGGAWEQVAKLRAGTHAQDANFGRSVAIDGDIIVAGAYRENANGSESGAIYASQRIGSIWQPPAKFAPEDTSANDRLGISAAVVGTSTIVGAYLDDDNGLDSGSAFIISLGLRDCNDNGVLDECDIASGLETDCNLNGVPDACEPFGENAQDCSHLDSACTKGVCQLEEAACDVIAVNEGGACDDLNNCTISDSCAEGACAGEPVNCSALDSDCLTGECNPLDGGCVAMPANEGGACDDLDLCTVSDVCSIGVCQGEQLDCSHLDQSCAEGVCNTSNGLCETSPVNEGGACDDADICTTDDYCSNGECTGVSVDCSYLNSACTAGACDQTSGECVAAPANEEGACDDLDLCTDDDRCQSGICVGTTIDCALYDVACLPGACNPSTGMCESPAIESDCNTNGVPDECEYSSTPFYSKILAPDGGAGDQFGSSIDIGESVAAIGAYFGSVSGVSDSGSVYVFQKLGDAWLFSAELIYENPASHDRFGFDLSISGSELIVGANRDDDDGTDSGAAFVFATSNGIWKQVAKLTAADAASEDYFGSGVALEGNTAVIGAYGDDDEGPESGSVYIFRRTGGVWQQTAKLTADDATSDDYFGRDVALSGDTIVVGAYLAHDNGVDNTGAAYVFREIDGVWQQVAKLGADGGTSGDGFGLDVDIDGDTIVVGAYQDDDGASNSGSAYVFREVAGEWLQVAKLNASDPVGNANFGRSVAIDGNLVVVGAYRDDGGGPESGAVYISQEIAGVWEQPVKFIPDATSANDRLGRSVAISGNTSILGAYLDTDNGSGSGSAFVMVLVPPDCNSNGVLDECDIASGLETDCNLNGIPDACEPFGENAQDCSYLDSTCAKGVCNLEHGTCVITPANEGGSCDDASDCTLHDVCFSGKCIGSREDCSSNGLPPECEMVLYVDDSAVAGLDNGTSWTDAYIYLQDALYEASVNCGVTEIWVAAGAYEPDEGGMQTAGDQSASFKLQNGLAIYGGFTGTETELGQRDPDVNLSKLTVNGSTNEILTAIGVDATSILDGFTVAGGTKGMFSEQSSPWINDCKFENLFFMAMENRFSSPTISNCEFSNNGYIPGTFFYLGGAIFNYQGAPYIVGCRFIDNRAPAGAAIAISNSNTVIDDCVFEDNLGEGAGIYIVGDSTPIITNSEFVGNRSGYKGGGIYSKGGSRPMILDCVFRENEGEMFGGGLFCDECEAYVDRCLFFGNKSRSGGAIHCDSGSLLLANSVLSGNVAAWYESTNGGGLYFSNCVPTLINCSFGGNTSTGTLGTHAGAIGSSPFETFDASNCIFWGNHPTQSASTTGNFAKCIVEGISGPGVTSVDPRFVDSDGPDNIAGTDDDDLRLLPNSPAIDAGDNSVVPVAVVTDLDGHARFVDDVTTADTGVGVVPIVDIGAYEFVLGDCDVDGDADLDDHVILDGCLANPGVGLGVGCACLDLDSDGDVDLRDFGFFQMAFIP